MAEREILGHMEFDVGIEKHVEFPVGIYCVFGEHPEDFKLGGYKI